MYPSSVWEARGLQNVTNWKTTNNTLLTTGLDYITTCRVYAISNLRRQDVEIQLVTILISADMNMLGQ